MTRVRGGIAATALAAASAAFLTAHHRGATSGTTRDERTRVLPGDDLVVDPQTVSTHAITVPAPPEAVWPWLVQMGWHRAGWYTARWVDVALFPENLPSADRVVPELQHLEVGDVVPDGPARTRCEFRVAEVEPGRHLVLRSSSHLPPSWRRHDRAHLDWTWAFILEPVSEGSRLIFRWRARTSPAWLTAGVHAFIVPADLMMSQDMLHGIRERVTTAAQPKP